MERRAFLRLGAIGLGIAAGEPVLRTAQAMTRAVGLITTRRACPDGYMQVDTSQAAPGYTLCENPTTGDIKLTKNGQPEKPIKKRTPTPTPLATAEVSANQQDQGTPNYGDAAACLMGGVAVLAIGGAVYLNALRVKK